MASGRCVGVKSVRNWEKLKRCLSSGVVPLNKWTSSPSELGEQNSVFSGVEKEEHQEGSRNGWSCCYRFMPLPWRWNKTDVWDGGEKTVEKKRKKVFSLHWYSLRAGAAVHGLCWWFRCIVWCVLLRMLLEETLNFKGLKYSRPLFLLYIHKEQIAVVVGEVLQFFHQNMTEGLLS